MSKTFNVKIVTMDKEVYNSNAVSLITSNDEGEIQFLANHATMITNSVPTETIVVDENNQKNRFFTSEGILKFENNSLTFMTNSAENVKDIDLNRAEEAAERAKKRISTGGDFDIKRAQLALARANERIRIKSME